VKPTSTLLASIFLAATALSTSAIASLDSVIATVNGTDITEWTFKRYASQRGLPPEIAESQQRDALIEELINRELIYQNAVEIGVDKAPAIQAEVQHQRINIIANSMLSRSSDRFAVSDAELEKEYEDRKAELGRKEFKARHILLEEEADAKAVIAELDKGADFASLAGKKSTGPSAVEGGDLGWFQASQMVKEFSDAAAKLKNGQYTAAPVKTQFGWHVILLEDTRAVNPPKYEDIKGQIRVGLQNKLIETYIDSLRKSAKIERK